MERVEHLDSSKSLHILTGVLDLLAGACDSPVLDFEGDLSTTRLSTGGLSWFSRTGITVSMRLCINVINDIKSNRLVWLIRLGNYGNITFPSSEAISESRHCWAGVWDLAGVVTAGALCPAGSATHLPSRQLPSHHILPGRQPLPSRHPLPGRQPMQSLPVTCSWVGSLCRAQHTCRLESSSDARRAGDWMTVIVVNCSSRWRGQTVARDGEGRDLWSIVALGWWWWW